MNLSRHLRARNCPVCGSTDRTAVRYPANFDESRLDDFAFASRKLPELMHLTLVECPGCHLLYASPALTDSFLANAYGEASYDSPEEAQYAARTYAAELPRIMKRGFPVSGTALEVGSGNGAFLPYLQKAGFVSVIGVEPSLAAVNQAAPDVRPLIRLGMFNPDDFAAGSLSLFACFQTIEHVENPRALCESAMRLLNSGGAVYLIGHDRESLVNRAMGTRSPIFDIQHQQLFSAVSLRYLLESSGFTGVEITTIRNRYPVAYWTKLLPIPRGLKAVLLWILSATRLGSLNISVNVGNLAAFGYKPRPSPVIQEVSAMQAERRD
jgi:SAM-dependent methyltransferase